MPELDNITTPPRPPSSPPNGTPLSAPQPTDQEKFDQTVDRDSKIVLGILAGVAVMAALIMSTVALVQSSNKAVTTVTRTVAAAGLLATPPTTAAAAAPIELAVEGSSKKGPDGKMHDAFTKTEFAAQVGRPLRLKIDNKDDVAHSITSPEAGVNIMAMPGVHSYTITVTSKGRFAWSCIVPCDTEANGWAMKHAGYMAGYITAS